METQRPWLTRLARRFRTPTVVSLALALACQNDTTGPADSEDTPLPSGRLAFVSSRDGVSHIYLIEAGDPEARRLTTDAAPEHSPAWSLDGRTIAFVREGDASSCGIHVVSTDGSGITKLTGDCSDRHPAWSPDGNRIVFSRSTGQGEQLYVMRANGSDVTQLSDGIQDILPAWSPDGQRIAFNRTIEPVEDMPSQIYVMNADGSGVRRLTPASGTQFAEGGPSWSPDGSKIAFWSFEFGIATIVVDGGSPISVFGGIAFGGDVDFSSHPDWSPDGRWIVFTRGLLAPPGIYITDVGSGRAQPLRTGSQAGSDSDPAWSRVP